MKEIFEQYGAMILAVLVALFLLGLLGSSATKDGLERLSLAGKTSEEMSETGGGKQSGYQTYKAMGGLTVEVEEAALIPVGKRVELEDLVTAKNKDGERVLLRLRSLQNESLGEAGCLILDDRHFTVETAGIYLLSLEGEDANGNLQTLAISLPASEEIL